MRANVQSMLSNGDLGALMPVFGGGIAVQGQAAPYAVWFNRFSNPDNAVANGVPCAISRTYQVTVWSVSYGALRTAEEAIISDVSDYGYLTNSRDGWDEETKLYYLVCDLSIYDDQN